MQRLNNPAAAREAHGFLDWHAQNARAFSRVVVRISARPCTHREDNMAPISMARGIWRKRGDEPPAFCREAGFFGKFPTTGLHWIDVFWFHAPSRKLKRHDTETMSILFDEDDVLLIIQGNDLDPIRIL